MSDELCAQAINKRECLVKLDKFSNECYNLTGIRAVSNPSIIICNGLVAFSMVKGRPVKSIINPYEDIPFVQEEEMVKKILFDGATNKMKEEDIDEFIKETFRYKLSENLTENAQLSFGEYSDFHENIYGLPTEETTLRNYAVQTDWVHIDLEDVHSAALKKTYDEVRAQLPNYDEQLELNKEIKEKYNRMARKEKILLFDKAIHIQHQTGSILDIDIEELKEEVDKKAFRAIGLRRQLNGE